MPARASPRAQFTNMAIHFRPPFRSSTLLASLLAAALLTACGGESPDSLVQSARGHVAKREFATAIIELKNALEKDVNRGDARLLLGEALLESGNPVAAEVELKKALDQKMSTDDVAPLLLRSYIAQGQGKRAVDEAPAFRMRLQSPAAQAEVNTIVAAAQAARGQREEAARLVSQALQAKPDHVPAMLLSARMAMAERKLDEATGIVDRAIAADGANAEAWKLKSDIQLARGERDQALASLRKAVEARPSFLAAHQAIAGIQFVQGKTDDAAATLATMEKISAKHPLTLSVATQLALTRKDLKKAQETSQLLLRATPDNLPGLLQAGAIEFELKSYVQAEGFFARALKLAPGSLAARRWMALTHLAANQPSKAVEVLKPVMEAIQGDARMLMLAGEAYMRNGDAARASELFAIANKLEPDDAKKRTRLAVSRFVQGDADNALQELERIAASDSGTSADMALIAGHVRRNEFDQALKAIDALEKKDPKSALPHELRGRVMMSRRDLAGARKSFARALELSPGYFPAVRGLAEIDLIEKKPRDAEERFAKLVTDDPKNVQAQLALAGLKARSGGSAEEVAALIRKAVTARPDDLAPRIALVEHYLRARDAAKAVSAGQDAVAALPNRPEVLEMLGQAQMAAGDYNQALSAFTKQSQLQLTATRPYLLMAEANVLGKRYDAAAAALRKALEIKPDLVEAQRGLIMLDMREGKGQNATPLARDIQKQRPKEAIGYVLEGDIAAARKSWPEAITAYRNGLKQAPGPELASRLHGALLAGANKPEADRFAAEWSKANPKDYAFQLHLGENALARNDLETAGTVYRGLLASLPDNPVVLNNLAWIAGKRKEAAALGYAEKANTLAPNQPAFMDTWAMLLAEKGELPKATELLSKAVSLAPQAAEIRLNYARVLIQAGKKPEARKELDEIAKLGNKFPAQAEVTRLLQTL